MARTIGAATYIVELPSNRRPTVPPHRCGQNENCCCDADHAARISFDCYHRRPSSFLTERGTPFMEYDSPTDIWPAEFWFVAAVGVILVVGVLIWVSLRNQIRGVIKQLENLNGRHDHVDRSITELKRDYYELAREFSEFRGELRGLRNAPASQDRTFQASETGE